MNLDILRKIDIWEIKIKVLSAIYFKILLKRITRKDKNKPIISPKIIGVVVFLKFDLITIALSDIALYSKFFFNVSSIMPRCSILLLKIILPW